MPGSVNGGDKVELGRTMTTRCNVDVNSVEGRLKSI
jgi:hypothetical protein